MASKDSSSGSAGKKSFAKHAAMQLVAGGSAGCIEVCIMHPLDLVKTRIQIQSTSAVTAAAASDPHHYTGIVDVFRKMYRHEGVFSFWKGILPPIMVETPKRAWKFFTFEQFKTAFRSAALQTFGEFEDNLAFLCVRTGFPTAKTPR